MKINKFLLLTPFVLGLLVFIPTVNAEDTNAAQAADPAVVTYPYEKTFTITAYYSPVEGQKRYIRGSLAADKKLNGNGTNGADGTPVFPGMIAAPKTIPFGTKMSIPGIGMVAVHDRGGAIVPAGQRGTKFDRLDVWMGYGDEGLNRALRWGRRTVNVTVYGLDESIKEAIDLGSLSSAALPSSSTGSTLTFRNDYGYGNQSDELKDIKQKFKDLGYFQGTIDDNFDEPLYHAVVKFQLDYDIVDNEDQFGAGYFGPQTRSTLEKAMKGEKPPVRETLTIMSAQAADNDDQYSQNVRLAGNGLSFLTRDLQLGDSGQEVVELQTELKKLHLFGLEPTGFYGEVTAHAVFKFQQSRKLVGDLTSPGAGVFGPITRQELMALVNSRIETRKTIASNLDRRHLLANK